MLDISIINKMYETPSFNNEKSQGSLARVSKEKLESVYNAVKILKVATTKQVMAFSKTKYSTARNSIRRLELDGRIKEHNVKMVGTATVTEYVIIKEGKV